MKSKNQKKIVLGIGYVIFACIFIIGCSTSDHSEKLSGNYVYFFESHDDQSIFSLSNENKSIYPTVIDYSYDDNFILVLQKPNYGEFRTYLADLDGKIQDDNSDSNRLKRYDRADSLLKNDQYYKDIFKNPVNYWIISNAENKIYGPFSYQQFVHTKDSLNIPASLNLDTGSVAKWN